MPAPTDPPDAVEVPVSSRGDGLVRTRSWTRGHPAVQVRVAGQWCPGMLVQREDRQGGAVVYHVDVVLPGATSSTRRSYAYDAAMIRAVREPTASPVETVWDTQGRIVRTSRPG